LVYVAAHFTSTTPVSPHPSSLSLHDALPISGYPSLDTSVDLAHRTNLVLYCFGIDAFTFHMGPDHGRSGHNIQNSPHTQHPRRRDRKSTRLNSSHVSISYAVFCLKKKINRRY